MLNSRAGESAMVVTHILRFKRRIVLLSWVATTFLLLNLTATESPNDRIGILVANRDVNGLRQMGPSVLPVLARMYETSSQDQKASIAGIFYGLGWKSLEAKRVLMKDVQTQNSDLRLQVQWALGRVSNDSDVVEVLLNNMQNDSNPLFRDKAACALANDQIHLTKQQKVRLYEGLIHALGDTKPQVRGIALLALQIQTGQTKNFNPNGSAVEREASIQEWKKWLEEYRSNL